MSEIKSGIMPIIVLRDAVMFPHTVQQLDIIRPLSVKAVQRAVDSDQTVFITMQRDPAVDEPREKDIYRVGVIAMIKQVLKHPSTGSMRISAQFLCRAEANGVVANGETLVGFVHEISETPVANLTENNALLRALKSAATQYYEASETKSVRTLRNILIRARELGPLTDLIAHDMALPGEQKQQLLEERAHGERCRALIAFIRSEQELAELQKEIDRQVQENIDANQKDFYLREQLKVIADQLGAGDNPLQDAEEMRDKLYELDVTDEVREQLDKCIDRLAKYPPGSHEASVERNYLELCLELPWNVMTPEKLDVDAAAKKLDKDHYGLEKVKERILEFIAVRSLAPDIKGQIICLVGPPGVGKTSIARSVAEALGRNYARISLGGIHDEADIRGHRRTYIGAMPGRIINAIKLAGSCNPLILFDEIDKLSSDYHGDPTSALLEVLDPEQNVSFHDHYVDLPFDLSNVMFITTANDRSAIPEPLLDRMEIIEVPSYTLEEKLAIARRHLVKKQTARHGMNGNQFRISEKALSALIDGYTREAGVRSLEREIASVCRKAAKKIASGEAERVSVTDKNLEDILGPAKYRPEKVEKVLDVGMVNGLAWTSVGGTMLEIEVAVMDGTGKIELTGSLGDVMQESAKTALSHVRFRAAELGIDPEFYKKKDIHIHAPEGAVPKDGPSAGITMATALVSALTGIPVRGDVAMTGEISLRGRVLAIGGLREKSMAAMIAGAKTVIIPHDNLPDVAQLSDEVKKNLTFVPVKRFDEVLPVALTAMPSPCAVVSDDKKKVVIPASPAANGLRS